MALSAGSRLAPSNFLVDEQAHRRAISLWEHEAHQGHLGNVGVVTLAVGAGTTVVTDFRVGPNSVISLSPTTLNAAQALTTTFISSLSAEAFTISHTNTATADRAFAYSVLG
jgi:hypothetical protein